MANRYAADILRIVGYDPYKNLIGAIKIKPPISAMRASAYFDTNGAIKTVSGAPGATLTPAGTAAGLSSPFSEEWRRQTGQAAGVDTSPTILKPHLGAFGNAGGGGPSIFEQSPSTSSTSSSGASSAINIIDGVAVQSVAPWYAANSISAAVLSQDKIAALTSLQATDCASGAAIDIRIAGGFPALSGTADGQFSAVSMSDWTDPYTPPSKPYVDSDYWWSGSDGLGTVNTASPITIANAYAANLTAAGGGTLIYYIINPQLIAGGTAFTADVYTYNTGNGEVSDSGLDSTANRNTVTPGNTTEEGYAADQATETAWPDDDTITFELQSDGNFHTSQYDNDVTAEFKNATSKIDFCMDGGRTGSIETTRWGGTMIYETSGGNPTGNVRVYDSKGYITNAADASTGIVSLSR